MTELDVLHAALQRMESGRDAEALAVIEDAERQLGAREQLARAKELVRMRLERPAESSNGPRDASEASSNEPVLRADRDSRPDRKVGFNVIGCLSGTFALGRSARTTVRLLRDLGYPVSLMDVRVGEGSREVPSDLAPLLGDASKPLPHPINLFHVNPRELGKILKLDHPRLRVGERMNVCVPFCELSRIPAWWVPILEAMDVVLAPTRFIQDAVAARVSGTVVRHYPQTVQLPNAIVGDRRRWSIPEGALVFGFAFDFDSVVERKNPVAIIEAFHSAFASRRDVQLVIKARRSAGGERHDDLAAELARLVAARPNVRFVDEALSYADVLSLMACWDVYVSLHRAEGLGLGLMESMAMGRAVIATGWSGNMEFMTDSNSALVGYRLVEIDLGCGYAECLAGEPGHLWAEPDVEEAAQWMRRLAEEPRLRRELGQNAREAIEVHCAAARRGQAFLDLERYWEQWQYRRRRGQSSRSAAARVGANGR